MSPAATATMAPAQEAGRPQPQTTIEPPGGPFIRHSQPGIRQIYANSGNALGGVVQQPLTAWPGYGRKFRVRMNASGGSASGAIVAQADAPYSGISQIILKDAFGTPLVVGPGYDMLKLVPKYGNQHFMFNASDPQNLPSWSAIATASGLSAGNFNFQTALPLEFAKAYGVISGANAALLPNLQWTLAGSSALYSTAPGTPPTVELDVDVEFYWLPEGVNVDPPGLGTTCQWIYQSCNPTIGSNSTTRAQLPRLGGYLHTLIFDLRDSSATPARIDAWPTRDRIYVDGVPIYDIRDDAWKDDMFNQFGMANFAGSNTFNANGTIETGVRVLTRKNSLSQLPLGLLDTGETYLSTNPGTLIEFEGASWGSSGTSPYTLNVVVGQVVPSGTLIQGLPEV